MIVAWAPSEEPRLLSTVLSRRAGDWGPHVDPMAAIARAEDESRIGNRR